MERRKSGPPDENRVSNECALPEELPRFCSIGQFAELSGISPRMLRFYAERDILVPAQTNPRTGYRRYLASQLLEAAILARLRDADFPARDMATILNGTDERTFHRLVQLQRSLLLRKIEAMNEALDLLDDLSAGDTALACRLIRTAPSHVIGTSFQGNRAHLRALAAAAAKPLLQRIPDRDGWDEPPLVCLYDAESGPENALVCIPVEERADQVLPGGVLAVSLHNGPYETLPATLARLFDWIGGEGHVPTGKVQEWYFPPHAEAEPFARVEVAIPVKPGAHLRLLSP